jgi:thiamine biosynthesis lipoprotein
LARDAAAWATMPRDPAARRDVPLRTWVEHVMGTAISISVAAPNGATGSEAVAAVAAAFAELRRADEVFSPFRPDSQISRLRDGRTTPDRCDPEVREILALCELLRRASNGYFDAYAAGPGQLDPCGVVKGWAAERAAAALRAAGMPRHAVNAGGDVRLGDPPAPGRPWRVGIADPHRPGHLLTVVRGSDLAVATSGNAERGAHVLDPHRRAPATGLASVTVIGPSLTLADAYATAAVAMGEAATDWLAGLDGYEALLVDAAGELWWTGGFPLERMAASKG